MLKLLTRCSARSGCSEGITDRVVVVYAHVAQMRVVLDHTTGKRKGFGFIEYADVESAKNAVRVLDGRLTQAKKVYCTVADRSFVVQDVGILQPGRLVSAASLPTGMVGYVCFGVKDMRAFRVGETFFADGTERTATPFPGFAPAKHMAPRAAQLGFVCNHYLADMHRLPSLSTPSTL